jgi:hypothetical protein
VHSTPAPPGYAHRARSTPASSSSLLSVQVSWAGSPALGTPRPPCRDRPGPPRHAVISTSLTPAVTGSVIAALPAAARALCSSRSGSARPSPCRDIAARTPRRGLHGASSPAARSQGGASPTTAQAGRPKGLHVLCQGGRPGPGRRPARFRAPNARCVCSHQLGPCGKQVAGGIQGLWSAQRLCPCADPRACL